MIGFVFGYGLLILASSDSLVTPQGAKLGADYPVFYAAGLIVNDGNPEKLYDQKTIIEKQKISINHTDNLGYHTWVYPPYVAMLFAPLASLPYLVSYLLFTALMSFSLWGAVILAGRFIQIIDDNKLTTFALICCFYPILKATTGGQNIALSLFLVCGTLAMLMENRNILAGLFLGLLFFKPHFALPLIGLLFLNGRYQTTFVATLVGLGYYLIAAIMLGWDWPIQWFQHIAAYAPGEAKVNGDQLISFLGAAEQLFGPGEKIAYFVAVLLTLIVILLLSFLFIKYSGSKQVLPLLFSIAMPGLLLLSPHTQFYELGLLVLPAMLLIDHRRERVALLVIFFWFGAWIHSIGGEPVIQPLFLLNVFAFVYLATFFQKLQKGLVVTK